MCLARISLPIAPHHRCRGSVVPETTVVGLRPWAGKQIHLPRLSAEPHAHRNDSRVRNRAALTCEQILTLCILDHPSCMIAPGIEADTDSETHLCHTANQYVCQVRGDGQEGPGRHVRR
jgi:hypothetical protein